MLAATSMLTRLYMHLNWCDRRTLGSQMSRRAWEVWRRLAPPHSKVGVAIYGASGAMVDLSRQGHLSKALGLLVGHLAYSRRMTRWAEALWESAGASRFDVAVVATWSTWWRRVGHLARKGERERKRRVCVVAGMAQRLLAHHCARTCIAI